MNFFLIAITHLCPKSTIHAPAASLIDPRTSSDFSALIARKAAEKRAKFTETKPSVNSITFRPGGSEQEANTDQASPNVVRILVKDQSKPKVIVPKPSNSNVANIVKKMVAQNTEVASSHVEVKNVVTINSGVKDKVSIFSQQVAQQQQIQAGSIPVAVDGKSQSVFD